MQDKFNLKSTKVSELYALKGNYEGVDYYQAIAKLDNGIKLKCKLTEFEYNTLKKSNA